MAAKKRARNPAQWIGVGAASREAVNSGLVDVLSEWAGFLPLELCPGINAFAELKPWARAKLKKAAYRMLLTQHGMRRRAEPLQGRPIVICTRFSSVEPDAHSGWSKVPVDCLVASWVRGKPGKQTRHDGLGFLADDRPSCVQLVTRWRAAPPGKGFVIVEVFAATGQQCARAGVGARAEQVGGVSR